jgi:hypothetical protein
MTFAALHESGPGTTRKRLAARIDFANWGEADSNAAARECKLLTPMYGPAVRCKRFSSILGDAVLHQCIRPLIGASAPGHHGYQRACDLILSQTEAGKDIGYVIDSSLASGCSFVRAWWLFLRPGLRVHRRAARKGRQGWPSR